MPKFVRTSFIALIACAVFIVQEIRVGNLGNELKIERAMTDMAIKQAWVCIASKRGYLNVDSTGTASSPLEVSPIEVGARTRP